MLPQDDEDALMKRHRYALQEIEREIRKINREVIHRDIPKIERKHVMDLAKVVAESSRQPRQRERARDPPAELIERLNRYQNTRGAGFCRLDEVER
jgi:hypothetical protein